MSEKEFYAEDMQVIGMVNAGANRHCAEIERNEADAQWYSRLHQLKRIVLAACRVGVGLLFVCAAPFGLIKSEFAVGVAVVFAAWALHRYHRGESNV